MHIRIEGEILIKQKSTKWKNVIAVLDEKTCKPCRDRHGKIYPIRETVYPIKLHLYCRCRVAMMDVVAAGSATSSGYSGADYYLKMYGRLPGYYLTKKQAKLLGWDKTKGNLGNVAPGKMIGGDVYYNGSGKLPAKKGRIWYEADIDYKSGYRNDIRILYSNDGLIFVTYDHYMTYEEVV